MRDETEGLEADVEAVELTYVMGVYERPEPLLWCVKGVVAGFVLLEDVIQA